MSHAPYPTGKFCAKISDETVTPLGFGRGIGDAGAFLELRRERSVDVVRPDIARLGISGGRRTLLSRRRIM
jgi:L-alanine-DL-glutamate epimerase-like enolase superfamily enzyme